MEPPKSATRKWLAIGLAGVIAWAIFLATSTQLSTVEGLSVPSLGRPDITPPVDYRWNLLDLEGKPVDFASFRGKPILLNLWATWCGPCLKEMPSIANLASNPRLQKQGVVFLCVSVDESPEKLRSFMKDQSWGMTILQASAIPPVFQTEGIPATFVISPDGQVVASEIGAAQWDDPSVVDFLEKLAKPAQ